MRLKHYILSLMVMLAMATSIQQPLFAEKKHSSSSSSHKDDKCCKESKKLLKQINQTTVQDLVVDQTTLNVVNQINQTTRADLVVDQETLDIVKHLQDCSCTCTVIMPQDFADSDGNLSQTYVIKEPGSYCLGADVAFSPVDEFTPAINILANDVRLDLRGFTLSQDPESGIPNAYGVQIGQGYNYDDPDAVLKNISITNGSIINFTAIGLFCYNGSFDGGAGELAFESLVFTDLNILDCGSTPSFDFASGIDLDSSANVDPTDPTLPVAYSNVLIENCNVNRCLGNGAIQIYTVDNIVVRSTQANDLSNPEVVFGTFAHTYYGRNIEMFNCQGNGVQQTDPFSRAQCGGCNIEFSVNVILKDCQFNDTFGEASIIVNSNISNTHNFMAENCQFNNSRGGARASLVAGVHMSDGPDQQVQADGMKWINCQFNGARVSDDNPGGTTSSFLTGTQMITYKNVIFENCQACNNSTENPGYYAFGFFVATLPQDPAYPFGNTHNLTFSNCVVSDITGGRDTAGIALNVGSLNHTPNQGVQTNRVVENCIVERINSTTSTARVAGIMEGLYVDFGFDSPFSRLQNLFIRNCRVSDVRSNRDEPSPLSAGILVESVINPVILNNSISDCDRGILFTGIDEIIPNCFQLAATKDDALGLPPVFIPLDVQLQVQTDQVGLGPFTAVLANYSPILTTPVSGLGAVAVDSTPPLNDACQPLTNNLGGKVGVARIGGCSFIVKTTNVEAAGGVATILVQNTPAAPIAATGPATGTGPTVMISLADGNALIAALNSNPNITVTIDTVPTAPTMYTFSNNNQANSVNVGAGQISGATNFICPSDDLTALGWQAGDTILFDCNGGVTIPGLECDGAYYAIVYSPGFSRNGLIQNNKIDNCSISCYQDDAPTTLSAWVNNTAFNCGTCPQNCPTQFTNYDIDFAGVRPVDAGSLVSYPVGGNKYYNLSLVP